MKIHETKLTGRKNKLKFIFLAKTVRYAFNSRFSAKFIFTNLRSYRKVKNQFFYNNGTIIMEPGPLKNKSPHFY